jgi:hypothetical protein
MDFDPQFYIDTEIMHQVCFKGLGLLSHQITVVVPLDKLADTERGKLIQYILSWFNSAYEYNGGRKNYTKDFTIIKGAFIIQYSVHSDFLEIVIKYDAFDISECEALFRLRELV